MLGRMTQPPRRPVPLLGEIELGGRAARALTTELSRHAGPKTGLLLAVTADSAVLTAALDGLLPGDALTLVPLAGAGDELRAHIDGLGSWVGQRVRVVEALPEADPADVVIVAQPLGGGAEETRAYLEDLRKYLTEGAVLCVAALTGPWLGLGAGAELDRQSAFSGVGTDLVVRNQPPVRGHRLRYTPAQVATAARLDPAYRPSNVHLTRSMNIDSNGVAAAGIALGLAAAARGLRPKAKLWLLPALAAAPVAALFPDPNRDLPADTAAVVAASDGTVLSVERLTEPRLGTDEWLRVAGFLSVLDVHVNRAPVAGKVAEFWAEDGGFAPARRPEAEHNVAAYTMLETDRARVVVAQRTGLVARRIVHRAPVGPLLARGEPVVLIRFGSRTDVYLPAGAADAAVAPGDKVRGGATVIARWRSAA